MKVLAVASGGGHWEEMMLIKDGFRNAEVIYANTFEGLAEKSGVAPAYVIADCNRKTLWANVACARDIWRILRSERPDVVVSTGAAPGLIALALAKPMGARTIWIDSIANSEELSMSGRLAGRFCDLWLTQWRHLGSPGGPKYWGSVL
ncbi:MAG: glucuronosyltransferase [Rhizobium sp.]|nr:glucuronosyltransferase [Rhizobium sp.]